MINIKPNSQKIKTPLTVGVLIFCIFQNLNLSAQDLSGLNAMLEAGEFEQCVEEGEKLLQYCENSRKKSEINFLLGKAKYNLRGERWNSIENLEAARKGGIADASIYLGRLAMLDYDFPEAKKLYTDYRNLKKKSGQNQEMAVKEIYFADKGEKLFERVRDIVVIDAISVKKKDILNELRLPLSAGRITTPDQLPLRNEGGHKGSLAFISESGDLMLWSQEDEETGKMRIMEASILADGTMTDPEMTPEFLGGGGNAINPFLSADGSTLYFLSDGDESMGGYDIFMATRDPGTGEYLQPVNVGIPFNSYSDEFLIAIDEENGVGWWATDRHFLEDDEITLYLYLLSEERKNIDADDEVKRERSILEDIQLTWIPIATDVDEDEDELQNLSEKDENDVDVEDYARKYKEKAEAIRNIVPGQKPHPYECKIPLRNGKFIYSEEDVKSEDQKIMVRQYIQSVKEYNKNKEDLAGLRKEYSANPQNSLGRNIASLEKSIELEGQAITRLLSQLYRSLGYK